MCGNTGYDDDDDDDEYVMFVATARGNSSSLIMCKDTEREALLQIKNIFVTNHFNVDVDSWVGEECCEWHGVVCDNVTANIIAFKPMLNKMNRKYREYVYIEAQFFESIVLALLRLKHLTYLKLTNIQVRIFSFPFPRLIVSMTNLKYLNISGNYFFGELPPQLGNLTNLEVLDLSYNYLDGKVPPQLGNLTKLKVLDLSHNNLEGKVPPQLGNLTELKVLDLSWNSIVKVESLTWVSCLSNLQYFGFSSLDLSSSFHTLIHAIDQLPSLTTLILPGNDLSNTQSSHLFFNNSAILSTLTKLDLSGNHLESPLTPNIGNLSSLSYLDLSSNSFNGSIPYSLRNINISLLQVLNLEDNAFSHVEGGIWGIMKNPCHFQHLDLSSNNLQDDIQLLLDPIGNASRCTSYDLNYLDLSENQISGSVPDSLRLLTEVEVLFFNNNFIQGNITNLHLDNLSKLSSLDVSDNNLSLDLSSDWLPPFQLSYFITTSCKINYSPDWLQTQTKIQYLDLSNSSISGELHEWFYNTSTLEYLYLSDNFLNGPLPKQFKSNYLYHLDLSNNNLSGILPTWFSYADHVDLSSNNLFGSIPQTLGHNNYCTIQTLILSGNQLEGGIPSNIGNCIFLEKLDLYQNRLSGKIPRWIGEKLQTLRVLRLQQNQFGEFLSGYQGRATIPKSLCKLKFLEILDFQKNKLSGSIPNCWKDSANLKIINLSSNNLSGGIPCSLGNLLELKYLHLSSNRLNGLIPLGLSNLTKLQILNMGENELSGSIPKWNYPNFSRLQVLRLPKNNLNGTIPQNLCKFSRLHILDLSHNQLVENVPTCLGSLTGINLPNISQNFNEDDKYSSSYASLSDEENKIMETIAGIEREYISVDQNLLASIDLSSNSLVGAIPEELTSLYGLIALNLANNHLIGNIPENIGDMKALETLDLSRNKLCGRIPTSLGNVDSLNHVNFSSNNLSGPIPSSRHFQTFDDPSIYAGNPNLCGDPLPKKCYIHDEPPITPEDQAEDDAKDKREKLWFYLVVMSGVATGFWGVIGILLVKKRLRHALFVLADDAFDWLYVAVFFKISKLKKMIKRDGNAD